MVFGRNHRFNTVSVRKSKDGNFRASKEIFYNNTVSGSAEFFILHDGFYSTFRFGVIFCENNAFAKGQTIRLDYSRIAVFPADARQNFFRAVKHFIVCCRNPVLFHKPFGKHFAAFNLGRLCRRAKCTDSCTFQFIHHTRSKRVVRCNEYKVNRVFPGKLDNTGNI